MNVIKSSEDLSMYSVTEAVINKAYELTFELEQKNNSKEMDQLIFRSAQNLGCNQSSLFKLCCFLSSCSVAVLHHVLKMQ